MSGLVEVVSAVIIRGGRILLTQRCGDKDFPFTWESPGGKVDGNETHVGAMIRELREELGIRDINVGALVWAGEFASPVSRQERRAVTLFMYRVTLSYTSPIRPREGQGLGWFTAQEMSRLSLAPANNAALEHIAARIS